MIPTSLDIDAGTESEEISVTIQNKQGAEPKKRPKKLRSIRISRWSSLRTSFIRGKSQSNCLPVISSSDTDISSDSHSESSSGGAMELPNQPPNYVKPTCSSGARKPHFKASPRNSESGSDFSDKSRKGLDQSSPNSTSPGVKSLAKKSGTKPVRVLTKTISLKHQRPSSSSSSSVRKGSRGSSQPPDFNVHKATCSSILKGSKLPDNVEIQAEGSGVLVKKVCPYSYCSLHGHKHDASPPLKQFVSTRRRLLKSQKGTKPETHSPQRPKQSGNKKKRNQNPKVQETAKSKEASIAGDDEAVVNIGNVGKVMLGESEENLQQIHCKDLKEEGVVGVSNLDNASDNLEEEDLPGVAGEPLGESKISIQGDEVGSTPIMVSDTQSSTDEETTTPLRKQNYSSLWSLIYQHMESDIAAKDGSIDEAGKGEKEEDANITLLRMNSTGSSQDSQEIELDQTDAIKLVQEAINGILYPETRDLSSEEQSVTSDTVSEPELDTSTSTDPDQDMLLKPKSSIVPSEEKGGALKGMSKSMMASNRWSNLKKVILMKRFVKALDRMRKINPQKPNYLPLEPDPESEKVSLRRRLMEERKNAEKFMLDYALQQVISKLAPAQKKRVELLVNAFETVIPPTKNETLKFRINTGASSPIKHAQDQLGKSFPVEHHNQEKLTETNETTSTDHKDAELEDTDTDQTVRVYLDDSDDKSISEVEETTSLISSNDDRFEMSARSTPGSTAINSGISSHSVLQTSEPTASNKMNEEAKPEESDPDGSTDVSPETPLAKQNYTRLWFMVYKHMASGLNETDETQQPDEADKKDQADYVEPDTSGSLHDHSEVEQDMKREDDKADEQKKKLQEEAVKLVQEAIDQILLPEVEDRFSDDQSISSDTPTEQELLEKNSEEEELLNSASTVLPVKETCRNPDKMEVAHSTTLLVSKNLNNQGEKATLKEGGKSNNRAPKNWSNLKKMILLRRFVKAMEKVRKLNPREPRFLPLEPNAESETVNLKHQDAEDRKNAEEWMLDYAIQQVVTKLSPARKKKVQLLVEAFETVTPSVETEPYTRRSPAASSRAHPFKSVLGH